MLFEPWVNLIFEAVHCLAVHCILTQLVPSIHYPMCEEIFPHIQSAVLFENGQRVTSSASGGAYSWKKSSRFPPSKLCIILNTSI